MKKFLFFLPIVIFTLVAANTAERTGVTAPIVTSASYGTEANSIQFAPAGKKALKLRLNAGSADVTTGPTCIWVKNLPDSSVYKSLRSEDYIRVSAVKGKKELHFSNPVDTLTEAETAELANILPRHTGWSPTGKQPPVGQRDPTKLPQGLTK